MVTVAATVRAEFGTCCVSIHHNHDGDPKASTEDAEGTVASCGAFEKGPQPLIDSDR